MTLGPIMGPGGLLVKLTSAWSSPGVGRAPYQADLEDLGDDLFSLDVATPTPAPDITTPEAPTPEPLTPSSHSSLESPLRTPSVERPSVERRQSFERFLASTYRPSRGYTRGPVPRARTHVSETPEPGYPASPTPDQESDWEDEPEEEEEIPHRSSSEETDDAYNPECPCLSCARTRATRHSQPLPSDEQYRCQKTDSTYHRLVLPETCPTADENNDSSYHRLALPENCPMADPPSTDSTYHRLVLPETPRKDLCPTPPPKPKHLRQPMAPKWNNLALNQPKFIALVQGKALPMPPTNKRPRAKPKRKAKVPVVINQTDITPEQQQQLQDLVDEFPRLFQEKGKMVDMVPIRVTLKPGANLKSGGPY
ncbi:hypothetical protein TWF481_002972 [Arthrobotrys musiformis]|uniref:Uncharacterized protein n=1 Tax=Arthrobotrys musiformis TaxID=47236 RepID=A0AAV9VRS9_9PEZI